MEKYYLYKVTVYSKENQNKAGYFWASILETVNIHMKSVFFNFLKVLPAQSPLAALFLFTPYLSC